MLGCLLPKNIFRLTQVTLIALVCGLSMTAGTALGNERVVSISNETTRSIRFNNGSTTQVMISSSPDVPESQIKEVVNELAAGLRFFSTEFSPPENLMLMITSPSDNASVSHLRDDDGYISQMIIPRKMFVIDSSTGRKIDLSDSNWRSVLFHEIGHDIFRRDVFTLKKTKTTSLASMGSLRFLFFVDDRLTEIFADLLAVAAQNDAAAVAKSLSVDDTLQKPEALLRDFNQSDLTQDGWDDYYQPFGGLEGELMKDRHLSTGPTRRFIGAHYLAKARTAEQKLQVAKWVLEVFANRKDEWISFDGDLTVRKFNELIIDALKETPFTRMNRRVSKVRTPSVPSNGSPP